MRLLLLLFAVTLFGCESFFGPHENESRTIEGCSDAVAHLRSCCPAWDSYISCTYLDQAIPARDVTAEQSSCINKTPCADVERAVTAGHPLCSFSPQTRHCR